VFSTKKNETAKKTGKCLTGVPGLNVVDTRGSFRGQFNFGTARWFQEGNEKTFEAKGEGDRPHGESDEPGRQEGFLRLLSRKAGFDPSHFPTEGPVFRTTQSRLKSEVPPIRAGSHLRDFGGVPCLFRDDPPRRSALPYKNESEESTIPEPATIWGGPGRIDGEGWEPGGRIIRFWYRREIRSGLVVWKGLIGGAFFPVAA